MVVGVEPFGHFQRRLAGVAASQLEVALGIDSVGGEAEARRRGAHQQLRVQHVVVQREIADRRQVDAGTLLQQPVALAQFARAGQQLGFADVALPVAFQQGFQFALGADAGEARQVGGGHRSFLIS